MAQWPVVWSSAWHHRSAPTGYRPTSSSRSRSSSSSSCCSCGRKAFSACENGSADGMDWTGILSDGIRAGLGINAAVYALAAVGLNVQFGYAGLWNFGQAGFLLVGGYGTAIAVNSWGLWLPWAVLVGIAASVLLGLLLGIPTLRLRGDYLAIVTIAAAEILRIVVNSTKVQSVTGGPQGIGGFANWFFEHNPIGKGRYGFGTITYDQRQLWVTLVTWALVALASVLVALLVHSPWGRVVRAIRGAEDAVRS